MPTAQYIKDDGTIDHTPSTDLDAGDVVVQGQLLGIATRPIPAGTKGSLTCRGRFSLPKPTGIGRSVGVGVRMFWVSSALVKASWGTFPTKVYAGKTAESAGDDDSSVEIILDQ